MSDAIKKQDEEERRSLQKYIFELEEIQEKAEELSHEHEQLKHSKDLLMAILRGTIHGICLLKERRFVWCNKAFTDILGWKREELIGKTTRIIYPDTEEYKRAGGIAYRKAHPSGLIVYEYEYMHKNGHRVPCLVTARALDEKKQSKGHVFSFTDFTERKRSRDALKKANTELEERSVELRLLNKQLKQAYQELKDTQVQLIQSGKLASIGELASGVAHELNQPLMVIRGTAQLIKQSIGKNGFKDDKPLEQMEIIEKNTGRMMKIINHLRTFSRQSQLNFQPVDTNRIIRDSCHMVGRQISICNIEVKTDLSDDLPKIKGDGNQLEQVFINLITNAKDAIISNVEYGKLHAEFKGRIEIITRMVKQATSSEQRSTRYIEVLFKDNGGGIRARSIEKIFDPFYTTKEVGKGTGLGLSISYGIIKDHKGEIEVDETGLKGTTFKIKLPSIENEKGNFRLN